MSDMREVTMNNSKLIHELSEELPNYFTELLYLFANLDCQTLFIASCKIFINLIGMMTLMGAVIGGVLLPIVLFKAATVLVKRIPSKMGV